jgi:hypothetical protein
MKRHALWLIGPLMLCFAVVAASPAAAATPRPSVGPAVVAGNYTVHANFNNTGYQTYALTLYANHTGTDHYNDTIVWSLSGKNLTMNYDDGLWTYLGTKTKAGFNNKRHPGTLSNINGGTGIWYAVKIP